MPNPAIKDQITRRVLTTFRLRFVVLILILFSGCASMGDMTDEERDWMRENLGATSEKCPPHYSTCEVPVYDENGNRIGTKVIGRGN